MTENAAHSKLTVETSPYGPDQTTITEALRALLTEPSLQRYLEGTEHRLLSFRMLDESEGREKKPSHPPEILNRFLADFYDYTHNRTISVVGHLNDLHRIEVSESSRQPLPTEEEFEDALEIALEDTETATGVRQKELHPLAVVPPFVNRELEDGRFERILTVGLRSENREIPHRITGVNMHSKQIVREISGLAFQDAEACGPPSNTTCDNTGNTGQVWITVTQGGTTLWRFLVTRPAASSGKNGSGIELRYVDYRGKRVLFQAHVPILNVLYDEPGRPPNCGPSYRDWQNQETCFQANGNDVIPGFRICPQPAQTILDTGTDGGNFRGVAIYIQGQEVVLVSQMSAGWYRYISEWRFHTDGTIRPRFGFAGVAFNCPCHLHHHHVYWRLDFDIVTSSPNVVQEYNNPPLIPPSNWHTKRYEIRRPRDSTRNRQWLVQNPNTNDGYLLIPGANDGTMDSYGLGDLWVLRYHPTEIDDGQGFSTVPAQTQEHIDNFAADGEFVENQDVVLWYAGHFAHAPGQVGHIVGPELKPFNW